MALNSLPYTSPEHQPFHIGDGPGGILMIHGFAGTPADVRELAESMAFHGWHVRAMLLPGFGADIVNLGKTSQHDWLSAAQSEWNSMRAQYQPAILLGYSMGGAIAIHLTSTTAPLNRSKGSDPDALILVAPFWRVPGFLARLVPLLSPIIRDFHPFKIVNFQDPRIRDQFERMMPGINLDDPGVREEIRSNFVLPLSTIDQVFQMGKRAFSLAPSIQVPTLILQGRNDNVVRSSQTRKLVEHLPIEHRTYIEIPGGHDILASRQAPVLSGSVQIPPAYQIIQNFTNRFLPQKIDQ